MDLNSRLQDLIIAHLARPYVRSRWPIYCDTEDHAVLLCGLGATNDEPAFFFHDDQLGPYLASRFAFNAAVGDMQFQAGLVDEEGDPIPEGDWVIQDLGERVLRGDVEIDDSVRGIYSLVVAGPTRMLLAPSSAGFFAKRLMDGCGADPAEEVRVSIMMGTDFKDERLRWMGEASVQDPRLHEFFATIHLAEWVVVVEGLVAGSSEWEVVYDGSSGSSYPLLQYARHGKEIVYVPPGDHQAPQVLSIGYFRTGATEVPSRIGKGQRAHPVG